MPTATLRGPKQSRTSERIRRLTDALDGLEDAVRDFIDNVTPKQLSAMTRAYPAQWPVELCARDLDFVTRTLEPLLFMVELAQSAADNLPWTEEEVKHGR